MPKATLDGKREHPKVSKHGCCCCCCTVPPFKFKVWVIYPSNKFYAQGANKKITKNITGEEN